MGKTSKYDRDAANKVQRDGTRIRGGWKDSRRDDRRNKGARNAFFAKGAE